MPMTDRLKADSGASIYDFFALVKAAWDITQEEAWRLYFEAREHPSTQPESNVRPVQMYEAYPVNVDINPELPLITYTMLKKYPMPEGKERKPRVMEFVNDANDPTQQVAIMGQRFDCLVQFETWADTNQDASRIAEDFEQFMTTYTSLFKRRGVMDIWYEEQYINNIRSLLPAYLENKRSRAIVYRVTIQQLSHYSAQVIDKIAMRISDVR
jgi:hypothetical protein